MKLKNILVHHWRSGIAGAFLVLFSACEFGAPAEIVEADGQGDPDQGKNLLFAYGCVACHQVPGLSGYPGDIGPPLTDWSRRKYIVGQLPNQPEMLVRWIMHPDEVEPGTAMPNLEVKESEARDIAAYLYSQ